MPSRDEVAEPSMPMGPLVLAIVSVAGLMALAMPAFLKSTEASHERDTVIACGNFLPVTFVDAGPGSDLSGVEALSTWPSVRVEMSLQSAVPSSADHLYK